MKIAIQGMWVFIGSEILFFGALFLTLTVYRGLYPQAFSEGTHHMNFWLGAVNTAVLLTSSWTLALAIESIKKQKAALPLLLTTWAFGFLFLIFKFWEYHQHYQEGLLPGGNWNTLEFPNPQMVLFFFLYYFMTGLHALHVLIGLGLILWLVRHLKKPTWPLKHQGLVENTGLYWHFVDIIWVFLFPALYLVGR